MTTVAETKQARVLANAITASCGDPGGWKVKPDYGYRSSLALCVVDSIMSTGINYGTVEGVVKRYRDYRGPAAATDGAPELLATFAAVGGVTKWAKDIGTDNRLYARMTAPLKAFAIHAAADMLTTQGVHTSSDFRAKAEDATLRRAWTGLPSQGSVITWHYAHMLAGTEGVKPDRMIRRFTASALGVSVRSLSDQDLIDLVTAAANELGRTATEVDHAIWLHASGRLRR